jgi:hypothetical protein
MGKTLLYVSLFVGGAAFARFLLPDIEKRFLPSPALPAPQPAPANPTQTIAAPVQSDVFSDFTA